MDTFQSTLNERTVIDGGIWFKKNIKNLLPKNKPLLLMCRKCVSWWLMVRVIRIPLRFTSRPWKCSMVYLPVKMSKKSGAQPPGYFDYVVPPLEGLWWFEDDYFDGNVIGGRMNLSGAHDPPAGVRTPVLKLRRQTFPRKSRAWPINSPAWKISRGLVRPSLAHGPYDDEAPTVAAGRVLFLPGYRTDVRFTATPWNLSGRPAQNCTEKLKTVIRHPIVKR